MLRGGLLAEVQLNCPPRQQRVASKANGRGRRPVLRTPHKTRCPQQDDERVPEACAEVVGCGPGSKIGTKIPARVPALQPLANANGPRSAAPPVAMVDPGASMAAPVRGRPSPTANAEQPRLEICQQTRRGWEEDMDELKARVYRSQVALEQLTEDNGRWLRDGESRCSGSNTAGFSSNGSSRWIDASGAAARNRCAHSSAGSETMLEVRERLIRADAQLQILAGLEKKAALAPAQTQARQLAKIGVSDTVAQHMSSDE